MSILEVLREELLAHGKLQSHPGTVWRPLAAINTWGSNAIEGNSLGLGQVQQILAQGKSVPGHPMWELLETVQHERAFLSLLGPGHGLVGGALARDLHREVFRGIMPDAGEWRDVDVIVLGAPFRPVAWPEVPSAMAGWEADHGEREASGEDALALAAWSHHRFESVHPFSDGNGRTGRLLLNAHLIQHDWPPVDVLPADRDGYLDALNAGHMGDMAPLEAFVRRALGRSLLVLLDQVGTREDALRPVSELARGGPLPARELALRASHGELPAVKEGGQWRTSERALGLHWEMVGRT